MLLIECLKSFTAKTSPDRKLVEEYSKSRKPKTTNRWTGSRFAAAFGRCRRNSLRKFALRVLQTGWIPTIATPTLGRGDSHGFSANVANHCNPQLPLGGQGHPRCHATRFLPTRENRLAGSRRNQERTLSLPNATAVPRQRA